jgi:superfamily II DNA/RNA helicase
MANITRALQVIETSKIQLFFTLATQSLDAHPQMKVVIAVNFVDTIADLKNLFEKDRWKVRLLTGSMSEPQRTASIADFQKASTDCRILLANQSVCSTGIDLDDKDGN